MLDPGPEANVPPYTAFRFEVELTLLSPVPGINVPVCWGAFAECDGLEMTMEPKAVREGGNNQVQAHLIGPISYGQLTLKRGMTDTHDLWYWFAVAGQTGRTSKANGRVTIADAAGNPSIVFTLYECLPVKLRGPSLNAKDGQIAIEEMQLVYSYLSISTAGESSVGASEGTGAAAGASAGFSTGAGAGASFGASASAGASVSGGFGLSGGAQASASATAGLDIG